MLGIETVGEALKAWDGGEIVHTIEMGGMGPGYEQVIHLLAFEIIRELQEEAKGWDWTTEDKPTLEARRERVYATAKAECDRLGPSGAQFGAAANIAMRALRLGWGEMVRSIPEGRQIMVKKNFPGAK